MHIRSCWPTVLLLNQFLITVKSNVCPVSLLPVFSAFKHINVCYNHIILGMEAVRGYYEKLGPRFVNALSEMLVFDAVIRNTDRHFGNFGVLVDNRTNTILSPAPLFDHGNSLFNFAGTDEWADDASLKNYIEILYPSVYDDFLSTAKSVLTLELREKLRHLLTFRFKKHSRYNLPSERLNMMEKQIQKRAGILLNRE